MPKGTRVHNCVDKLKGKYGYSAAIAICQKSTNQNYMTGKTLKRRTKKRRRRRAKGRKVRKKRVTRKRVRKSRQKK